MPAVIHSRKSSTADDQPVRFDPDEMRRLFELGKQRGLIRGPGPETIEKNGIDVTAEAGLRSQWIEVTPELAEKWLKNNFRNRPISTHVVAAYARDMLQGVWVPTHQGIAFNDKDELIDGQHRLRAILESGVTVRTMVTFGLPSMIEGSEMTTMDAVDRGRPRSVADQLKIQHGLKNGSVIAAVCASVAPICSSDRTRRLSVGQTLEIYRAFENPIAWVIEHRSTQHGLRQAGVLAAFAFAMATETKVEADGTTRIARLYEELVGANDIETPAIKALHAFLTSDEARLLNRGTDRGLAEFVLQAIFLALRNKKVTRIELSADGATHFRSLQPERVQKVAKLFALPKRKGGAK